MDFQKISSDIIDVFLKFILGIFGDGSRSWVISSRLIAGIFLLVAMNVSSHNQMARIREQEEELAKRQEELARIQEEKEIETFSIPQQQVFQPQVPQYQPVPQYQTPQQQVFQPQVLQYQPAPQYQTPPQQVFQPQVPSQFPVSQNNVQSSSTNGLPSREECIQNMTRVSGNNANPSLIRVACSDPGKVLGYSPDGMVQGIGRTGGNSVINGMAGAEAIRNSVGNSINQRDITNRTINDANQAIQDADRSINGM